MVTTSYWLLICLVIDYLQVCLDGEDGHLYNEASKLPVFLT